MEMHSGGDVAQKQGVYVILPDALLMAVKTQSGFHRVELGLNQFGA